MKRLSKVRAAISADELTSKLAKGGLAGLVIKASAAGLSLVMFLVIARSMDATDYGLFGYAFSLATFLAVLGSFGQRTLVLRFLPIYLSQPMSKLERGLLIDAYRIVMIGCFVVGAIVASVSIPALTGDYLGLLVSTIVFTVVLGLAELQTHVIRGYGGMIPALLPRDVIWRVLVILCLLPFAIGILPAIDSDTALLIISILLAAILLAQGCQDRAIRNLVWHRADRELDRSTWRHVSIGLWGTSIIQSAAPNLAVVIIGLLLSASDAGLFFAALRTAMLLNLFLMASNMIAAPLISKHFHADQVSSVQRICSFISVAVGVPSLVVFSFYVGFGDSVLGLFSADFREGRLVLIVLSFGFLVNALAGPTSQLMEMTGNERAFFRIVSTSNVIAIACLPVLTAIFGTIGAAMTIAGGTIVWNAWTILWLIRNCGIDPSVLSVLRTQAS